MPSILALVAALLRTSRQNTAQDAGDRVPIVRLKAIGGLSRPFPQAGLGCVV